MSLTGLLFMMTYLGGLGLAFVRGPIFGLWTYMAVFYLHPPSRWWGVGLPPMRWALFAALVTLVALMISKGKDKKSTMVESRATFYSHGFSVLFSLLVGWMWLQAPWVISPEHMQGVVLFTKYLLMTYLIYEIVRTPEQIRDTLIVHVVGCVYLGWLAYNAAGGGRLEGVGGPGIDDSNSMAMQFGTALVAGGCLMLREKMPRMLVIALMMPLILNGLLQGNSRGAYLAVACAGIIIWWMKPGQVRGRFTTFAALAVCAFLILAPSTFWERIATLGAVTDDTQELDGSAASRFVIISAQLEMFADYPLGAGHKGTAELSPDYIDDVFLTTSGTGQVVRRARSSHNTYMSVVVDHGVVGLVIMICVVFWAYRCVRRSRKRFRNSSDNLLLLIAVTSGLAVVALAGVFAPYLKAEVMFWMLSLLMCVSVLKEPDTVKVDRTSVDSTNKDSFAGPGFVSAFEQEKKFLR